MTGALSALMRPDVRLVWKESPASPCGIRLDHRGIGPWQPQETGWEGLMRPTSSASNGAGSPATRLRRPTVPVGIALSIALACALAHIPAMAAESTASDP